MLKICFNSLVRCELRQKGLLILSLAGLLVTVLPGVDEAREASGEFATCLRK